MPRTRLRNLLQELHGELENSDSVEPESRDLLREVMDDIHDVLDRTEAQTSEKEESIGDRLSQAAVEFENSHPQVAFVVRRLMKSLTDIGI